MITKYLTRKDAILLLVLIGIVVLEVGMEIIIPSYIKNITNVVTTTADLDLVRKYGIEMLFYAVSTLILLIIAGFLSAYIATNVAKRMRETLYTRIDGFSSTEIDRFSVYSLITRSTNDVTQVQIALATGMVVVIKAPVMGILAIKEIAMSDGNWTVIVGAALLALVAVSIAILILVVPHYRKIQWMNDDVNRSTNDNISGLRTIHAYNAEGFQEEKFDATNKRLTDTYVKATCGMSVLNPIITVVMSVTTLLVYWAGGFIINNAAEAEKMSLFGDMMTFSSYSMMVITAFLLVVMILLAVPRAIVAYKRIEEVISTEPSIKDGDSHMDENKGDIILKDVSFRYPNGSNDVIKDVSLEIKKGETVAFIGPTGCGKTTLMELIMRFYDVTSGEISIGGTDVRQCSLDDLKDRFGYVPQKSIVMDGTLGSNINYGSTAKDRTEEDIRKAMEIAQCTELASESEGLDRKVSENGSNLSGGQRQRLSIARALCRRPEILIFDDSFSALDFKTDRALREALNREMNDTTVLLVSQRIGTIIDADKIVVMKDGSIVGVGKHRELMKTCDVYRELAELQLPQEAME